MAFQVQTGAILLNLLKRLTRNITFVTTYWVKPWATSNIVKAVFGVIITHNFGIGFETNTLKNLIK